jgi:hypothetical protein
MINLVSTPLLHDIITILLQQASNFTRAQMVRLPTMEASYKKTEMIPEEERIAYALFDT